jgi:hypothetical protein
VTIKQIATAGQSLNAHELHMSAVNHNLKSCFIHVPKTGGSSMESLDFVGGAGHASIKTFDLELLQSYFKWAFVRHPYTRFLSAYLHRKRDSASFQSASEKPILDKLFQSSLSEFVTAAFTHEIDIFSAGHFQLQSNSISENGKILVDFLGRFETIQEDWGFVCSKLGQQGAVLPRHNTSDDQVQPTLSERDKEMLYCIYRQDFELLGYKSDFKRKIQVVVIGHGKANETFKRHEKFWLRHNAPILVSCPSNDLVETNHEKLKSHPASHHGIDARDRLLCLMHNLKRRDWDWCVLYEYDSIFIQPDLPVHKGFYGVVFKDVNSPDFMARRYVNPPWCFDRDSFELMMAKADAYPGILEGGYADRYFSALADLAGVPIMSYDPPGFSRATITDSDLPLLNCALNEGAMAIHGIKDESTLNLIEQFASCKPDSVSNVFKKI